jgi:hypothetical protein
MRGFVEMASEPPDWMVQFLSWNIQRTFKELSGKIQGKFKEYSGNILGTFRENSRNFQGTFREHSGKIHGTLRGLPSITQHISRRHHLHSLLPPKLTLYIG